MTTTTLTNTNPPNRIEDVAQLEALLSEPSDAAVAALRQVDGDVMLLGVGGKMGPTLAKMVKRAADQAGTPRRIIGASRFSDADLPRQLEADGIETIKCDLLNEDELAKLPDCPNIIYMAGMKFGSTGKEALTWAMNTHLPALVSKRFAQSRIVGFSTGNVYGLVPIAHGGSRETDPPNPDGEYAISCLGRERIFEHFSRTNNTPMATIRLNYAVELRYGVLVDLAQQVYADQPIDLSMGNMNVIWQADANAMTIAALAHADSPPFLLNVAGPEILSVRQICQRFGELLNKNVQFIGEESPDALINNGQKGHRLFGYPRIGIDQMQQWIADWLQRGGETLGKPTHFEVRDGKF
ncbi:MAG: NAD-dependent epimerase/dehydratase family protein [Phycisphaeraceae bacterium]